MIQHQHISQRKLRQLLKAGKLAFAGNRPLKIYGRLNCKSGKRMRKENRVFFAQESEATSNGFRPCGHCMREKYVAWKKEASNTLTCWTLLSLQS